MDIAVVIHEPEDECCGRSRRDVRDVQFDRRACGHGPGAQSSRLVFRDVQERITVGRERWYERVARGVEQRDLESVLEAALTGFVEGQVFVRNAEGRRFRWDGDRLRQRDVERVSIAQGGV